MTAHPQQLIRTQPPTPVAGAVIWITGLSGAGKSTVAAELAPRLTAAGQRPILLDGDQLRAVLDAEGYDEANRRRLAFTYARLCRLLAAQGQVVICATIALFHDVQAWNRANLPNYLEVFLDVPIDELERRNSKGVYRLGAGKDVVGVGIRAEFPVNPDLTISNFGATTPAAVAADIIRLHREKGLRSADGLHEEREVRNVTTTNYTLEWDYTELAKTYSLRPEYAPRAIDRIVQACGERQPVRVADIGAGTGHLSLDLLARNCLVDAVEPNEAMRTIGIQRTAGRPGIRWSVGIGEDTGLEANRYDLVTFGSSFSNTDQPRALRESRRILQDHGHFACIWNHRDLEEPLQAEVEALIHARVPDYSYGRRRQDHSQVIEQSQLFGETVKIEEPVRHTVEIADWITAWRSHATLQRQAGANFHPIVDDIERLVRSRVRGEQLVVPYLTVGWLAPVRVARQETSR